MAIYRPPKARWPLALMTGILGLVLGLLGGWLLGDSEPPASESVPQVRSALLRAAGSLEVAVVEYKESVGADGEIVKEAEYEGSLGALESSRDTYLAVASAIRSLDPERADYIEGFYARAERLMDDVAPPSKVEPVLQELGWLLKGKYPTLS